MKKVLLAVSNEEFNRILRHALSPYFDVISNPLYHVKYLREFIESNKPDILIAHDTHFGLNSADVYEKEVEWLNIVENLRLDFDDTIRFVFLCERKQGDPFLSELVNRNVLDIFHHRQIDIKQLVEQLQEDPKYSKAARLVVEGSTTDYQFQRQPLAEGEVVQKEEGPLVEPDVLNIDFIDPEELEKETNPEGKPSFQVFPKKIPSVNLKDIKSKLQIPFIRNGRRKSQESEENEEMPELNNVDGITVDNEYDGVDNSDQEDVEEAVDEGDLKKQIDSIEEDVEEEKQESKGKKNKTKKQVMKTINIKPRLIAVGSINPGAGSTFLLHNFTRYLSDQGIATSILEAVNDYDALYSLYAAEQLPPDNWDSIHQIIQSGREYGASLPKWEVEGTLIFAQNNSKSSDFSLDDIKELLFLARQAPIVFVDISHNWNDSVTKEVLRICDELWCVTDANPHYIRVQRDQHKMIYQVTDRVGEDNVIVIGNRWVKGVDESLFPRIHTTIPFIKDNAKALQSSQPAYCLKPKEFGMFSQLLDRIY